MIEPDIAENFPMTDFEGGKTGDAWWIRSKKKGLDVWGERQGDDFDIVYSDEEEGLKILVGQRNESVGLNLNQMLIAVYDRWSGELTAFTAGLGICILDSERGIGMPPESIDQALGLIEQGEDILATLDLAEMDLSLLSINQVGATLLGVAPLLQDDPDHNGYEFRVITSAKFEGVSLELGVSRDSVDLFLYGKDEMAVRYQVARRVDLKEIAKQRHPDLKTVKGLIRSTFLTLDF